MQFLLSVVPIGIELLSFVRYSNTPYTDDSVAADARSACLTIHLPCSMSWTITSHHGKPMPYVQHENSSLRFLRFMLASCLNNSKSHERTFWVTC